MLKKMVFCIVIILLSCIFCTPVLANAAAPTEHITIKLTNIPDNVVYADLLIKIDENDENFSEINRLSLDENGLFDEAQIVTYNDNGFRSFTFHYHNAKSNIKINEPYPNYDYKYVDFCKGIEYREYLAQYEDLRTNYKSIKIALLNEQGDIVSISKQVELPEQSFSLLFFGTIEYDVATENIVFVFEHNHLYILFSIVCIWPLLIFFSIGLEVLTAVIFKFRGEKLRTITKVNVLTQILMRILYLFLPFTYLVSTIVLEFLMYGGEFLFYKKSLKGEKTKRVLVYTVVANTISLLFGLLIIKIFDLYFF